MINNMNIDAMEIVDGDLMTNVHIAQSSLVGRTLFEVCGVNVTCSSYKLQEVLPGEIGKVHTGWGIRYGWAGTATAPSCPYIFWSHSKDNCEEMAGKLRGLAQRSIDRQLSYAIYKAGNLEKIY